MITFGMFILCFCVITTEPITYVKRLEGRGAGWAVVGLMLVWYATVVALAALMLVANGTITLR